jgi:hypothetical protein
MAPARNVDGAGLTAWAIRKAGDWAPTGATTSRLSANQLLVRDPVRLVGICPLSLVDVRREIEHQLPGDCPVKW